MYLFAPEFWALIKSPREITNYSIKGKPFKTSIQLSQSSKLWTQLITSQNGQDVYPQGNWSTCWLTGWHSPAQENHLQGYSNNGNCTALCSPQTSGQACHPLLSPTLPSPPLSTLNFFNLAQWNGSLNFSCIFTFPGMFYAFPKKQRASLLKWIPLPACFISSPSAQWLAGVWPLKSQSN